MLVVKISYIGSWIVKKILRVDDFIDMNMCVTSHKILSFFFLSFLDLQGVIP